MFGKFVDFLSVNLDLNEDGRGIREDRAAENAKGARKRKAAYTGQAKKTVYDC